MEKKGQITVFIILIIIILSVLTLFLFNRIEIKKKNKEMIEEKIENCLESAFDNSISSLSQGSIFCEDYGCLDLPNMSITYFYYEKKTIPDLNVIKEQFEKYASELIVLCLKEIKSEMKIGEINVEVKFEKKIKLYSNLSFFMNGEKRTIEKREDYKINFPFIYQNAREIIEEFSENPEYLNINYLLSKEINIIINPVPELNSIVFELVDENSEFDGKPFEYYFAMKIK